MAHHKKHGELERHIHSDHKMHASVMKHIEKLEHAVHMLKEHMHGKKHDPKPKHHAKHHESRKFKNKVEKVMHEYKEGALHAGSKKGPKVKNPKQAIAIALSEARRRKKK
jgi:lactam utilization protein B